MKKLRLRKKRVLLLAVIVTLIFSVGITLAFMFRTSEDVKNIFFPAKVTCEVNESFNGTEKSSIKVKNTGNTNAFLRVRLVSYWVNASGEIVGKPSEMPAVSYDSSCWTDGGNYTYICKSPVAADSLTPELLTSPILLKKSEYLNETVYQVVEVFADGIQSAPLSAAQEAWNFTP